MCRRQGQLVVARRKTVRLEQFSFLVAELDVLLLIGTSEKSHQRLDYLLLSKWNKVPTVLEDAYLFLVLFG